MFGGTPADSIYNNFVQLKVMQLILVIWLMQDQTWFCNQMLTSLGGGINQVCDWFTTSDVDFVNIAPQVMARLW